MKFAIFGFSQRKVCGLKKEVLQADKSIKTYILDVTDLLILQELADFMNRQKVVKYVINNKEYFSITYKSIIEDLPILNIQKQALRDRIDKLCIIGLLEKEIIKDVSGSWSAFRMTDVYESLKYDRIDEEGVCSELHTGVYQTTHGGCVSDYTPKNNTTIDPNSTTKEIKKENPKKAKKEIDWSIVPPAFTQVLKDWLEYKKERNQSYKPSGFKSLVKNLLEMSDNNPEIARAIVEQSKSNNYSGLFPLNKNNQNNNYGRETVSDKMRRTIAEAEEFDRMLTAQREAGMGGGDSKPIW